MNNKNIRKIKGATMTEYILIIGLIAGATVVTLTSVGTGIVSFFTKLNTVISSATTAL